MTAQAIGGMCGIAGCPEPACGATVTFAAPHPIDKVLTEFEVPVCEPHRAAIATPPTAVSISERAG